MWKKMDSDGGGYLGSYQHYFNDFIKNLNPLDQLPVKISSYDVTKGEIVGEIIDMTLQYLNQRFCPPSLQAHLVKLVIEEIKSICRKQPEDCGFKPHENTYGPLKLMQAVTRKVNEICYRYLDNSRLALLPPPPSNPLPLTTSYAIKNTRRKMEDRSVILHDLNTMFSINDDSTVNYYAVFDGHAGSDAATYCAAHLHQYLVESVHYPTDPVLALQDAFLTTDARLIEKELNGGSTAVVALLVNKVLYIAWAGDSQAALAKNGTSKQLVDSHKPEREDERKRVEKLGGQVLYYGIWRVNGQISVSRSIGDRHYKPFISGEPEIVTVPLDGSEDFLIVACDGLWDCVDEVRAATVVYDLIRENPKKYEYASFDLVELAKNLDSQDNISVIVVFLTPPKEIAAKLERFRSSVASRMDPDSPQDAQHPRNFNSVDAGSYPFEMNFGARDELSVQHPGSIHAVDAGCCPFEMNFGKQQQQLQPQQTNGSLHIDSEKIIFEKSSNGRHKNGSANYDDDEDDDDLGPETDVDAVDEASETVVSLEKISRELFPEKSLIEGETFQNEKGNTEEDPELPSVIKSRQHELLPEADNVADSEDSEDEWNYYRVEPDKDKDSSVSVNESPSESKEEKEACSPKRLIEDDSVKEPLGEEFNCTSKRETEPKTPSPELIDTECSAERRDPDEDFTFRKKPEHPEDMEFHLNPDAKEFIPPSMFAQRRSLDYPISGSPLKQAPTAMDDIPVPSEREFEEEISHRPSDMSDDEESPSSKPLEPGYKPGLDDSEISSTKAEFGDESTTSFLTTSEFQRTGISAMDCSFTGSDREDYDITKDPMAMSFTPGDFEAAFEKGVDLNAVHDLSEVDFSDNLNRVNGEEEAVQSPQFETGVTESESVNELHSPLVEEMAAETLNLKPQNPFDLDTLKQSLNEEGFSTLKSSVLETEVVETDTLILDENSVPCTEDPLKRSEFEEKTRPLEDSCQDLHNEVSPVSLDSTTNPVSQFDLIETFQSQTADMPLIETYEEIVKLSEEKEEISENKESFFENKEGCVSESQNNIFENNMEQILDKPVEAPDFEPEVEAHSDIEFDPEIQEKSQTQFELSLEAEDLQNQGSVDIAQFSDTTDKSSLLETPNSEVNQLLEQKTNYAPVLNLSESLQEFTGLERQFDEAKESENFVKYDQVTDSQTSESTIPKENIDIEQKDVVENLVKDNDLANIETQKVEEAKNETPVIAAAIAGAVPVAATIGTIKAAKKPATTVSKTSMTKTSTASKTTKSIQSSPTKTSTATRTTTTVAKKQTTGTISRPKQLDNKSATSTASKAPGFRANPAPKTTTASKLTPRLSASSTPKPKTPISPKPAPAIGEKKPTTNGDIKSLANKTTATKLATKPTSTTVTRTNLVKSSTTSRTSTSATTAATPAKSRPASSAATTKTAPKTATAMTSRPKTAPTSGSTLGAAKARAPAPKSPMIDKQIKETANKQISSSRASSATVSRTSRPSTATSTTTTAIKRTSMVKASTTTMTSPIKKPAPITKTSKSSLTKNNVKTAVSTIPKSKPIQNGDGDMRKVETITTATPKNIEEDMPKKDVSPVAPPTDNQLIMSSE